MYKRSYSRHFVFTGLLAVLLITGLFFLDQASAQAGSTLLNGPENAGGPDIYGYTFRDSFEPDGPVYAWEEISTSGTLIESWCGYDDCYAGPLPLGFDFNYYGSDFSEFYVSTNGYISFGQGWGNIPGGTLPQPSDPNNDIALFGGDMYLYDYGNESRVYYQTLTDPTRLVIEFIDIHYCCSYNTPHTFEVTLFENGDILSQYASLNGTSTDYVGIENNDGTDGLGYGAYLGDQLSIRYYYPTGIYLTPSSQPGFGKPGETVSYTQQLINRTGEVDIFDLEIQPGNTWTTTLSTDLVGPIEDGESITFTTWVEIPADAQPGDADTATIQATSVNSPSITATATINTIVLGEEIAYVTLEDSNKVALVDVATQVVVDTIDTSQYGCYSPWRASMSPDGAFVYFGCYNSGSVLVLETASKSVVANIYNIPSADGVAFTQSGDYALVGSRWSYQIAVIDTATYNIVQYIYTNGYPRSIAMHPYVGLAYATSGSGDILVIDTSTFTIINSIHVGGNPWDVAISLDGAWVFAGDRNGSGLWVIDSNTNTIYTTVTGMGELTGLEVSSDGAYIYAGGLYYEVWIIDGNTFSPITSVSVNDSAWDLALTGDDTQLYVGNTTTEVAVIDALNFTVLDYIPMPGNTTRGVVIRPQYVAKGAFLIPPEQTKDGGRGEVVTYQEMLFNNSGITETFDLQVIDFQWDTQLSTYQIGPLSNGESADFNITVTVPVDAPWYDTDSASILATGVISPSLTAEAQLTTTAFAPAQIGVEPESLESTQYVGEVTTQTLTISNGPGVTLTYDIIIGGSEGAPLDVVLASLNSDYTDVTDLIPNRFDFDEGVSDCSINDGGNDMYDGGNYLSTDLGGNICYSDNTIITNSYFGENGHFFTRKLPGLFVLAADIQNVNFFQITGNLGADGGGNADGAVLQTEVNGITYYGFVKRVYNAGDPSVNHLVIVAGNPSAGQDFSTYTDDDYHQVYNLGVNTRLYYLLYAGASGYYIDDTATLEIMRAFLMLPGMASGPEWLSVDPDAGSIPTNGSAPVQVIFDASGLQPGEYNGGLNIYSNDPSVPYLYIPATMTVLPTADMGQVSGSVSDAWTGDPLNATVELVGVYTMNADPDYNIWAVEGTYSITAYTADYYTITLPIEITAGETTVQDIALEPALPRLGELPDQISMSLPEGSSGTQALEINNTGPIPLDFAYFEINPLKSLNGTDDLIGKHILYDQAHCQEIYQYNYSILKSDLLGAGATIDVNIDPFDESTLEGYNILWLNDGECAWTFPELEILDDWLAGGGTILIQSENSPAASMPASIFDIIYQSGNCNTGTTTNINPHPITEGVDEFYIEWTCGYITGSPEVIVLDQSMQPHVIAAEQGRGKMVVVADNDFYDWVINNNDNRLVAMNIFQWLAIPTYRDIPWLSETPEQGSIPGHSGLETTLTFDASDLTPGEYDGFLAVEHNDPNQVSPVLIPVQLTVTAEVPPESITINGPDMGLVGKSYDFTAVVEPDFTILPLTYVWEADGQLPITQTNGLSDMVSYIWEMTGTQQITVTASNEFGSVSATYQITITRLTYTTYLPLVQKAIPGGLSMNGLSEILGSNDNSSLFHDQWQHRK